jgi:hypothetical protein
MRYIQPFGEANPNASYRDRTTGAPGSRVPAKAIEHPMREIDAAIMGAGLTPNEADLTQLLQAIDARIAALTGGGPTGGYALVSTIRSNMPIYPEVLTSDGKIPCVSPGVGQFRVPAGYSFLHRGYHPVTTVESNFATSANKTYHCFWDPDDGVQFEDLAGSGYNPGAAVETSTIFDSNFDRMLICRVTTDAGNVLTITNLVNKDRISFTGDLQINSTNRNIGTWETDNTKVAVNAARKLNAATLYTIAIQDGSPSDEVDTGVVSLSRYQIGLFYRRINVIGDACRIGYTAWG